MAKWFREQPDDFYSNRFKTRLLALAALYWTRSRLRGEMKHRNKVHIPSYILFLFHSDALSVCKETNMEVLLSEHPV
jgi:hypothetical protein